MSVVAPPSSNENVGNAGAGGSVTQLSPIAWSTSSISMNTLQSSNLYPAITSGSSLSFSWFHNKKFRVMQISTPDAAKGYVSFSYPGGSNSGRSFRYDTYSYVQITATAYYPYVFLAWTLGGGFFSSSSTVTLYSTDYTSTAHWNVYAEFTVL